jgi:chromate transporter
MRRPGWSPPRSEGISQMQDASHFMCPAVIALEAPGVFLSCYLFTIISAPYFRELSHNRPIKAVVDGMTAAAMGLIGGAVVVLSRRAIVDASTALIALTTLEPLIWVTESPSRSSLSRWAVGIVVKSRV